MHALLRTQIAILAVSATVRQALIAQADAEHTQYPQYKDHWNHYTLGYATRQIQTKLGLAAEAGDIVLVRPHYRPFGTGGNMTFYSWRNRIDTASFYGVRPYSWEAYHHAGRAYYA